jgi:hypothetical protein
MNRHDLGEKCYIFKFQASLQPLYPASKAQSPVHMPGGHASNVGCDMGYEMSAPKRSKRTPHELRLPKATL